ncbi:hypothetical protein MPSEU_000457700 [Mayamaea pseudoterrestris]|nr:hypothetical protein MPSEU_000457700 [Mayamaea pseudoterrestris]
MASDPPSSPRHPSEPAVTTTSAEDSQQQHDASRAAPFYGYPGPPGFYGYPPPGYPYPPPPFNYAAAYGNQQQPPLNVQHQQQRGNVPQGWAASRPTYDPRNANSHAPGMVPSSSYAYAGMPQYAYTRPPLPAQATVTSNDAAEPKPFVAPSSSLHASTAAATESAADDSSPSSRDGPPTTLKTIMEMEAERLKNSTEQEITLSQVDPIRTDFYWFVLGVKDALRVEAEREVETSIDKKKKSINAADKLYLINTNLNSRLMRAWEDLSPGQREMFVKKEEDDRRRFQEEDEVASRHCATLTSRSKSASSTLSPNRADGSNGAFGGTGYDTKTHQPLSVESQTEAVKREADEVPSDDASPLKRNRTGAAGDVHVGDDDGSGAGAEESNDDDDIDAVNV